jgi:AraC-like DNA-binding protein
MICLVIFMLENVKNLEILSVWQGISTRASTYKDRFCHCFVYKLSGRSRYESEDRVVTLEAGNVLYIPQGYSYSVTSESKEETGFIAVNFCADLPSAPAQLLRFSRSFNPLVFFKTLLRLWIFEDPSKRYQCYAMFYSLLAEYSSCQDYHTFQQKHLIQESLSYLEQHIFDKNISIYRMIACSNVSETYFRQLFRSIYGVSAKQYIQDRRLAHAYTILESGDYTNIHDVAAIVGYEDALYFSRVFKRKYGVFPSFLKYTHTVKK